MARKTLNIVKHDEALRQSSTPVQSMICTELEDGEEKLETCRNTVTTKALRQTLIRVVRQNSL